MSVFSTCVVSFFSPSDVAMSGDGGGVALGTDGFLATGGLSTCACFSPSCNTTSGDGDGDILGTEGFCFTRGFSDLSGKVEGRAGFSSGGLLVTCCGFT